MASQPRGPLGASLPQRSPWVQSPEAGFLPGKPAGHCFTHSENNIPSWFPAPSRRCLPQRTAESGGEAASPSLPPPPPATKLLLPLGSDLQGPPDSQEAGYISQPGSLLPSSIPPQTGATQNPHAQWVMVTVPTLEWWSCCPHPLGRELSVLPQCRPLGLARSTLSSHTPGS